MIEYEIMTHQDKSCAIVAYPHGRDFRPERVCKPANKSHAKLILKALTEYNNNAIINIAELMKRKGLLN